MIANYFFSMTLFTLLLSACSILICASGVKDKPPFNPRFANHVEVDYVPIVTQQGLVTVNFYQ